MYKLYFAMAAFAPDNGYHVNIVVLASLCCDLIVCNINI